MTCRHSPGDPNCSSHPSNVEARRYEYEAEERARKEKEKQEREEFKRLKAMQEEVYARTPDKEKYEIVDMQRIGPHVVMKVLYPNCSKCSYEGNKIMVFLNVSESDIIKWRIIDPHFRDPAAKRTAKEAPGPAARFPASKEGWDDALAYAERKKVQKP